jgi:hypothetical protein
MVLLPTLKMPKNCLCSLVYNGSGGGSFGALKGGALMEMAYFCLGLTLVYKMEKPENPVPPANLHL